MQELFTSYDFPNFGWTRLPPPPITKEDRKKIGLDENCSNALFLRTLCQIGYKEKLEKGLIPKDQCDKYIERCEQELKTFEELHFVDYILLVWATVEKARNLGVFMDWGRGSVSSSAACWFLKISGCDPIKYGLFFSRFISKVRAGAKIVNNEIWISVSLCPDVDINLGEGLDGVVAWLKEIYPNRVCKISNLTSLTGKMCVKDVYKTMKNVPEYEAQRIADCVERRFGVVEDLEDVYKENVEFKTWADKNLDVYKICLSLENLLRQRGVHASGYLIAFEEFDDGTPLVLDKEKNQVCAFVMEDVQSLKLDLLSLDTNRMIKEVIQRTGVDMDKVNLEDNPLIYDRLISGDFLPYGLYQISADCAYGVCKDLRPKDVLELSHVNAIARPASLAYKKPYLDPETKCPHEIFRKCLEWTNFQPLYQEQTISMVKAIGFTEEEAEQFRYVFAKKKIEKIPEWVEKVRVKLHEQQIPKDAGDILLKLTEESANYQFNLAHSISTSYLTACTVFLKYQYPSEFFVACANEVRDKADRQERLAQIHQELKSFGIKLLPPSILKSSVRFSTEGSDIRFGLSSIKGISDKNIEKLIKFTQLYKNKLEVLKAASDTKLRINILTALILSGCIDELIPDSDPFLSRNLLLFEAQIFNLLTDKEKLLVLNFGERFKYSLFEILKYLGKNNNENGKPYIKASRMDTIRKKADPFHTQYKSNTKNEEHRKFSVWYFEKSLLGFSYSVTLQEIFRPKLGEIYTLQTLQGELDGAEIRAVGEISEFVDCKSKNGNRQWKFYLSDQTSKMKIYFTNNKKGDKIAEYLDNAAKPKDGDIVIITGQKKENIIFANQISVQEFGLIHKISEIEKELEGEVVKVEDVKKE